MTTDILLTHSPRPARLYNFIDWRVLAVLGLAFVLAWRLPPLAALHGLETLFPVALHTINEQFAVVVALMIFGVCWHSYHPGRPYNVMLLACGFLASGLLDIGHMLSYRGMPVLVTPAGPDKAIAFWLTARYSVAFAVLLVALWPVRTMPALARRAPLLAATLAWVAAVYVVVLFFPQQLPRLFIDGVGLTPVKVMLEIGVIALTVATLLRLCTHSSYVAGAEVTGKLVTACAITVLSELCLTLYSNVNDLFSLLGHLYKIVAYYYTYRAVFVASVREPLHRLEVEVAERKVAEGRAEHLAHHDPLTGLPNRLLLRDRVDHAISRAARSGKSVVLMFLDLDNFKGINDSLGHPAGDALLRAVAARLAHGLRVNDTISRQGGDEFVILLPDLDERDAAMPVLDRVQHDCSQAFDIDGRQILTSASIGIAVYPQDGADFETLQRHADMAMYRAKAGGRNTYRFFDEHMQVDALGQLEMRNGLRLALERGELLLNYQPQVDLADGAIIGVEALLRWQRPGHGMVSPASFIPVAEDSGLIVPIGAWVLREACKQGVAWLAEHSTPLRVAVNLSSVQFARPGLVASVQAALHDSCLPPALLELELTESILLHDTDHVLQTVNELRALGVTMSIDDFGTGYSSLLYLRRFPVQRLKIDQSFVRDMGSDPDAIAIVRAVVELARSLGMSSIGEGVETEEMASQLRALRCDEAQGYYFGRPVPAQEIGQLLRSAGPIRQ